ncbi:hypothetical protein [Streptomyces pilosus]|uniref:hypothetical protein n=1 Tax=Streptomyces pilosus TaxID=28893 RepID=UPI003631388F
MTCEDTTGVRLAWEVQLYDRHARAWLCRAYGRATTTVPPDRIAHAVLAGYLILCPPGYGDQVRARAWPDDGQPVVVTPDQLPADRPPVDDAVLQALPRYLHDVLTVDTAT